MNSMPLPTIITEETFYAYLKCRYKAYLKLQGAVGEVTKYERLLTRTDAEYRKTAERELLRTHGKSAIAENLLGIEEKARTLAQFALHGIVSC
jgi:hypothetical protein